jgi:hypothetical protein
MFVANTPETFSHSNRVQITQDLNPLPVCRHQNIYLCRRIHTLKPFVLLAV